MCVCRLGLSRLLLCSYCPIVIVRYIIRALCLKGKRPIVIVRFIIIIIIIILYYYYYYYYYSGVFCSNHNSRTTARNLFKIGTKIPNVLKQIPQKSQGRRPKDQGQITKKQVFFEDLCWPIAPKPLVRLLSKLACVCCFRCLTLFILWLWPLVTWFGSHIEFKIFTLIWGYMSSKA